jgi:large subunit ribosomal protein L30
MPKKTSPKKLQITWVKSTIGATQPQRGTIRALGLRRRGQVVEHEDTPMIRGMIAKVDHLVVVEEASE